MTTILLGIILGLVAFIRTKAKDHEEAEWTR